MMFLYWKITIEIANKLLLSAVWQPPVGGVMKELVAVERNLEVVLSRHAQAG